MTFDKFKEIFDKADKSIESFGLADISRVHDKINLSLKMDKYRQLYYYEITADDIESSNLNEEDVELFAKDGWEFDKDKNSYTKIIR